MPNVDTILAELGCDPQWLDVLDSEFWQGQYLNYQTSDDKNTEHYRFAAFRALLANTTSLTNEQIDQVIALATLDSDHTMGGAALAMLAQHRALTDEQLQRLIDHAAYQKPFLQKLLKRVVLLRALTSEAIDDALFDRCLESNADVVQRAMLDKVELNPTQLEVLKEQGTSRPIRNIAKQRLQRRRKN
jgi:hypothetical protein